jgi:hypothetical protein
VGGACIAYGGEERRGVNTVIVGKTEVKKPIGRPRRRWGIMLRQISRKWDGEGGMDGIDLVQDRDT